MPPTLTHWAISRAVCVLRLISMADSRTERLRVLLPASIRLYCQHVTISVVVAIRRLLIEINLMLPSNSSHTKLKQTAEEVVAAASDRRKTVIERKYTRVRSARRAKVPTTLSHHTCPASRYHFCYHGESTIPSAQNNIWGFRRQHVHNHSNNNVRFQFGKSGLWLVVGKG